MPGCFLCHGEGMWVQAPAGVFRAWRQGHPSGPGNCQGRWPWKGRGELICQPSSRLRLCGVPGHSGFVFNRVLSSPAAAWSGSPGLRGGAPGLPLPVSPSLRWHIPWRVDGRVVKTGCALLWPSAHRSGTLMSDSCHRHEGERHQTASEKCCVLSTQGSGIARPLLSSSSPGP